jgi:hypothetical protein
MRYSLCRAPQKHRQIKCIEKPKTVDGNLFQAGRASNPGPRCLKWLRSDNQAGSLIQTGTLLAMPVIVGVMLARFRCVVHRVAMMAVRNVRVMPGFLVVGLGVMLGCGAMMLRGVFVMFGGFQVMIGDLFGHKNPFAEF